MHQVTTLLRCHRVHNEILVFGYPQVHAETTTGQQLASPTINRVRIIGSKHPRVYRMRVEQSSRVATNLKEEGYAPEPKVWANRKT